MDIWFLPVLMGYLKGSGLYLGKIVCDEISHNFFYSVVTHIMLHFILKDYLALILLLFFEIIELRISVMVCI